MPPLTVGDLADAMERLAPTRLAAEWDNVGLLLGARDWPLESLLLTTDLTQGVLDEAIAGRVGAIVSYHPPIFEPLRRWTDASRAGRLALALARSQIAVYSPHTALDSASGGLGDWLAASFAGARVSALVAASDLPATEETKLVTFCPVEAVDRIRTALAAAGSGRIGNYEQCSFEVSGQGTFFGNDAANPVVGTAGILERVDEVRLEMVCAHRDLAASVAALRSAHPYEEPPIEIHPLVARPAKDVGVGRRVDLAAPTRLAALVATVKQRLGVESLRVAAPRGLEQPISRIGLCPGAGGELLQVAMAAGCDLYWTGEMRHHDVLDARERGCAVLLAGHTNTERPYLPELAERLTAALPGVTATVSRADRWPLENV